ncbi:MAG: VPLPA-CTERM sorting domain-containing protein [Thermodesulfobacteriota bacterium]
MKKTTSLLIAVIAFFCFSSYTSAGPISLVDYAPQSYAGGEAWLESEGGNFGTHPNEKSSYFTRNFVYSGAVDGDPNVSAARYVDMATIGSAGSNGNSLEVGFRTTLNTSYDYWLFDGENNIDLPDDYPINLNPGYARGEYWFGPMGQIYVSSPVTVMISSSIFGDINQYTDFSFYFALGDLYYSYGELLSNDYFVMTDRPNVLSVSLSPGYYSWNASFYAKTGELVSGGWWSEATVTLSAAPVPIPGAIWLLGSGLVGLIGWKRRLTR